MTRYTRQQIVDLCRDRLFELHPAIKRDQHASDVAQSLNDLLATSDIEKTQKIEDDLNEIKNTLGGFGQDVGTMYGAMSKQFRKNAAIGVCIGVLVGFALELGGNYVYDKFILPLL